MTNSADLKQLEHWGYSLLPVPYDNYPGYTGIMIMMQDDPDPTAFLTPVSLHVHTVDPDGHTYWETLHVNNKRLPFHTICPGKFHIRDQQGNEITFFSFGANIELEQNPDKTVFIIRSAAPILELSQDNTTVATNFAEEVESLLARLEARWMIQQEDHHDFFTYLTNTFLPFQLYIASIQTLLTHFNEIPTLRHNQPQLYHLLKQEKSKIQEKQQWPETPLSFDELFVSKVKQ